MTTRIMFGSISRYRDTYHKKWGGEETVRFKSDWLGGMRLADMERRYKRTAQSLISKAKRLNLPARSNQGRLDGTRKQRIAKCAQLFRDGYLDEEIAEIMQCDLVTVREWRREAGCYRNKTAQVKAERREAKKVRRDCLRCRRPFNADPVDFVCSPCKQSNAWRSGGDYSMDSRL